MKTFLSSFDAFIWNVNEYFSDEKIFVSYIFLYIHILIPKNSYFIKTSGFFYKNSRHFS